MAEIHPHYPQYPQISCAKAIPIFYTANIQGKYGFKAFTHRFDDSVDMLPSVMLSSPARIVIRLSPQNEEFHPKKP
jgi:hypothetical protein